MDISKHPAIKQSYELCLAVDQCKASPEQAEASDKASDMLYEVKSLIHKINTLEELVDVLNH